MPFSGGRAKYLSVGGRVGSCRHFSPVEIPFFFQTLSKLSFSVFLSASHLSLSSRPETLILVTKLFPFLSLEVFQTYFSFLKSLELFFTSPFISVHSSFFLFSSFNTHPKCHASLRP